MNARITRFVCSYFICHRLNYKRRLAVESYIIAEKTGQSAEKRRFNEAEARQIWRGALEKILSKVTCIILSLLVIKVNFL